MVQLRQDGHLPNLFPMSFSSSFAVSASFSSASFCRILMLSMLFVVLNLDRQVTGSPPAGSEPATSQLQKHKPQIHPRSSLPTCPDRHQIDDNMRRSCNCNRPHSRCLNLLALDFQIFRFHLYRLYLYLFILLTVWESMISTATALE